MNDQRKEAEANAKKSPLYVPPARARHSEPAQRLASELARTLSEFEYRQHATADTASWWNRGRSLADEAKSAMSQGHRDAAWALTLESRRCLVPLLSEEEKSALAISLRREATKLTGWRRDAMESLLGATTPGSMRLMEALYQVDTAHANRLRELRLRRSELTSLMVILFFSLAGILTTLFVGADVDFKAVTFNNGKLVALVLLFGVVGATLSAMQRTSRRASTRVPDQRAAAMASLTRSLSGAGTGLVALAAAQAGLLGPAAGTVLVSAFAAGFSERFILRFIPDDDGPRGEAGDDAASGSRGKSEPGGSKGAGRENRSELEVSDHFRASVGAAVLNGAHEVLAFERADHPRSWQLPQGGIEPGETPVAALYRELYEETGLTRDQLDMVKELPDWLAYELPEALRSPKTGRGQTQRWFILRLTNANPQIRFHSSAAPAEFSAWKWINPPDLVAGAIEFRQPIYRQVAKAIAELPNIA